MTNALLDSDGIGVTPANAPPPAGIRRLTVVLIQPTKYDDEGYVMRYFRGVLPSNTLATLAALTEAVARTRELGVPVRTVILDEHVQRIDPRRLARRYARRGARMVVGLCGVQTNQFPRAADLALAFRAAGVQVMIGGFHVSGAIAMGDGGLPDECRALADRGVTLVKGEVEECWGALLRDALHGQLAPFYDVRATPDLERAPVPAVDARLMRRFVYPHFGTIDAGRGCPFHCSFCTVINVQGRKVRCRSAASIAEQIRANARLKIDYYFFTDDNFARNPRWEAVFDAIIRMRREQGIAIQFMMQVDVLAHRQKDFVAKAAAAGCSSVFVGMESLNPDNLKAAGKTQNLAGDYRDMVDAWHARGIPCHAGYIIGFPFDTRDSVRADVRRLRTEVGVDQASFFMLTPLPGSADHKAMRQRGERMDADYNNFDSFHATTDHPRMSAADWTQTYLDAWHDFYAVDSMKEVLRAADRRSYWGLFKNFLWYRHSAVYERSHPMVCGLFRRKDRRDRRPGYVAESLWRHAARRLRETARWWRDAAKLYFEMQEVWLATRPRSRIEANLKVRYGEIRAGLHERAHRFGTRARRSVADAGEALGRRVATVRAGAERAWKRAGHSTGQAMGSIADGLERQRRRGAWWLAACRRLASRWNPFAIRMETRSGLDAYWRRTRERLSRGEIVKINPFVLTVNAFAG